MRKFHSIAAICGDGVRPELKALFDRLAVDPHSELFVRPDGMIQSGPDPRDREGRPSQASASGLGRFKTPSGGGIAPSWGKRFGNTWQRELVAMTGVELHVWSTITDISKRP
jgi:hypothetical protein